MVIYPLLFINSRL